LSNLILTACRELPFLNHAPEGHFSHNFLFTFRNYSHHHISGCNILVDTPYFDNDITPDMGHFKYTSAPTMIFVLEDCYNTASIPKENRSFALCIPFRGPLSIVPIVEIES